MPTAQRVLEYYKKRQKRRVKKKVPILSLLLTIIILGIASFFLLKIGMWDESDNFSVVIAKDDGNIIITALDKGSKKVTNIYIPGDTQVSVSRQLGTWKIKSVWKLGENERIPGELVRETIVKNFHFPVLAFTGDDGVGFANGNARDVLRAVFVPYKTNLTFGDRLKIALFTFNVGSTRKVNINLEESSFLKPTKFVDGESGYIVSTTVPKELLAVFSDTYFVENDIRIQIKDSTGRGGVAESIGSTLEFMGGKVASLVRDENKDIDCEVRARNKNLLRKISYLLNCTITGSVPEGNFDMEVIIGQAFAKRY